MNYSIIFYIMGWILNFEAAFMVPPCIVALIYGEQAGWRDVYKRQSEAHTGTYDNRSCSFYQ